MLRPPLQMQMLRPGIWQQEQQVQHQLLVQLLVEAEGLAVQGSAGAEAGVAVQHLGQQQQQSQWERLVVQKEVRQQQQGQQAQWRCWGRQVMLGKALMQQQQRQQ